MYQFNTLFLTDLTVDHLTSPIGIDTVNPCFAWKLNSDKNNTVQNSYRLILRDENSYRLLFQEDCPSWLYEVKAGATTMWESWGAIAEDGAVSTYSYNHYAFGCVGEWMYRHIGGLQIIEPGYK